MKNILSFLLSRWLISFVAVVILSALIWFFGPFIHVFSGVVVRLLLVLTVLLVWLGVNYGLDQQRRKRDNDLLRGVVDAGGTAQSREAAEEVAAISERLKMSLTALRKAHRSRGYLHEQPWYVIIGPPGAGKTTALLNSGLKFPLAAELGQGAINGVGGTRLCDWWFTDQAVLIDTAGRYTTQDSNTVADKAGWEGFLDMLERTRRPQALNGIIVAISLTEIANAPSEERSAHARSIRMRIKETSDRLNLRLPVYLLLTKVDLLSGFTEFFDNLDQDGRSQVWGVTFPAKGEDPVRLFKEEFHLLSGQLDEKLIDSLQRERSLERRSLIAGFPSQFSSLEQPLQELLTEAFGNSLLDPAPYLRGVYFTSGTQEGAPIDRLTGALSRTFGIVQKQNSVLKPVSGRSYFLGQLLKNVIFGEAMMAVQSPAHRRRRALRYSLSYAGMFLVLVGVLSMLAYSYSSNRAAVVTSNKALSNYLSISQTLSLDPVQSDNLTSILPLLDAARAVAFGPGTAQTHSGLDMGLGQTQELRAGANSLYANALDNIFLPRLILQMESEMRGGFDQPAFLYQATRVYLMLGGQGPMDKSLVEAWMKLEWQRLYPGITNQPLRDDLIQHLESMLSSPLPPVPLDGALVQSARSTFSRVSMAERVYSRIRDSQQAQDIPDWVPAQAMGAAGVPFFYRASGKALTEGIPGFYTLEGFQKVLLPDLEYVSKDVADESWVLGPGQQTDNSGPAMQDLESNVISLYEDDYKSQWNALLGDLNIRAPANISQAVQMLYIMGAPQSPMQRLLVGITTQLQLSKAAIQPKSIPDQLSNSSLVSADTHALQGVIGGGGTTTAPPGEMIDNYYSPLISYINGGSSSSFGLTLSLINSLQQQLANLATSTPGTAPASPAMGGNPASLLQGESTTAPQPVARWVQELVTNADVLRGGTAAKAAAAAFNGASGPGFLCRRAVMGRYPFSSESSAGIPLGDFTQLFAPNGMLDSFFVQQVQPYVDMSGQAWRVQAVNGVNSPVSQGDLDEFHRAEIIKEIFFSAGSTPKIDFSLTPNFLDAGSAQAVLQLGGVNISYAHGPQFPTMVSWPGSDGMQTARLIITPTTGGEPVELDASGPWALFRLFSQGVLTPDGSSSQYLLTFSVDGRNVSYKIDANSVLNPFMPGVLSGFQCPSL